MNFPHFYSPFFGVLGFLITVLWWALIIWGIIALIRWLNRSGAAKLGMSGGQRTPLEILKERYAKGEIDKTEFEDKKKDLM